MPRLPIGQASIDAEGLRSYKRPYKKSISGCMSCKARKVKCDEQRPLCGNCKRRYIDISCCEYNSKPPRPSRKLQASPRHPKPTAAVRLDQQVSFKPFEDGDSSNRVLELRLLHHYTKTTCSGDSLRAMVPLLCHPMWEVNIPQVAFSSPIVLDALLGISALHLLALQPGDHSMALASRSYFNKAVTKQRDALPNLNTENAEPLLVAAVLIAHHTWLAAHVTEHLNERYNVTLQTYQMCKGIQALIRRASPWLERYSFTPEKGTGLIDGANHSRGFMKHALNDLTALSACFHREGVPAEDSAAYEGATNEVAANYSIVTAKPFDASRAEQEIVTILHRMPQRYLELLEGEDPLAMAILARNLCLLSFCEESKAWWIHGAGQQKVPIKAVQGIRGLMPNQWLWTMDWPMKIISKEITLDAN